MTTPEEEAEIQAMFPPKLYDSSGVPLEPTLWDHYAAAALTGMLTIKPSEHRPYVPITEDAARLADEMLAERARRGIK